MDIQGIVIPPGGGAVWSMAPGRAAALKLLRAETDDSVMMFEETAPVGTETVFHLHHYSDEVAYVLAGEVTFKIGDEVSVGGPGTSAFMPRGVAHAWKVTGTETGRILFLYTPGAAGTFFEESQQVQRSFASMAPEEVEAVFRRHGSEIIGAPPF
jgi:quercetin dioxygenase-like cupin family protein